MRDVKLGDSLEILKKLPSNSLDSLVTDPPAGISFMGKDWDDDKGGRDQWVKWMTSVMKEALRVLKPGAHGLVWALPRTSHWTATALEDAGFEVRDVVTHLFGTGFPKSLDISKAIDKAAGAEREVLGRTNRCVGPSQTKPGPGGWPNSGALEKQGLLTAPATDAAKQWQGWGTALKPASEHWILVRKPLEYKHTVAANVLKHGTGGLNVDASRIGTEVRHNGPASTNEVQTMGRPGQSGSGWNDDFKGTTVTGRFPANLVLDEEAAALLDAQSGALRARGNITAKDHGHDYDASSYQFGGRESGWAGDTGGASRFFYVAKASKSEKGAENTHPTVKSLKLMEYLIRLVTPPGGTVLDPFAGSGSTGVAAVQMGFECLLIEKEVAYWKIALKRVNAVDTEEEAA